MCYAPKEGGKNGATAMKQLAIFIVLLLIVLTGCSNKQLTRIDINKVGDHENENAERIVSDKTKIEAIENSFSKVNWEPNTKASMERIEDVRVVFLIQEEKNMPEKLTEYKIWFEGNSATMISSNPEESFGRLLDKEMTRFLESELMK